MVLFFFWIICCNKEPCEQVNLWGLLLLEVALQNSNSNPDCYSLTIKLCNFTKSSNVSSSGLDCEHYKYKQVSMILEKDNIRTEEVWWGMKIRVKKNRIYWSLTVARRPILFKASSISRGVHMCWSDLRNILRFSLKAELTYN